MFGSTNLGSGTTKGISLVQRERTRALRVGDGPALLGGLGDYRASSFGGFRWVACLFSIWTAQQDNRKWKTLDICAQHELSGSLSSAVECLRRYFDTTSRCDVAEVRYEWRLILNYLDAIAIGVEQGLYIEDLAKDHLKQIVTVHVEEAFGPKGSMTQFRNDYLKLRDMHEKWQRDRFYYRAYRFRWRNIILHPLTVLLVVSAVIFVIVIAAKAHGKYF